MNQSSLKTGLLFAILSIIFVYDIFAGPIEEAKKNIYYEKYNKAVEILSAFLQNSKLKETEIEEATYYLGRAFLLDNKKEDAKKTYQNSIKIIPASALNMVGLGAVLLLEGGINESQTLFDNAILQTKSKNIEVYTALANAYAKAKNVDAKYAQTKFSLMHEKIKKTPEFFIALGDFFARLKYGNDMYTNYQLAIAAESNNAPARFRLAKLFRNQNNKELFEQNMIEVTMLDKNFAPAYYELYLFYYNTDITKSKDYFLKYKNLMDPSPKLEFEEASILYASKDFQKSLSQCLGMIDKLKEKADVRCYRLAGYTYNQLGDTTNAIKYLQTFFDKADQDIIDFENYRFMATLLTKFPERTKDVVLYYEKAYIGDTMPLNKINDIKAISAVHKKNKNYKLLTYWSKIYYTSNPKQTSSDLFNWGYNSVLADDYLGADSIFSLYINKYPNEYFGHYWKARVRANLDTSLSSAVPFYTKTIEITSTDTTKYKNILTQSHGFLYSYHRNKLKNYNDALYHLDKLSILNPQDTIIANDKKAITKYLEALKIAEEKKAKAIKK